MFAELKLVKINIENIRMGITELLAIAATRVYEPSNQVADALQTAAQRVGVLFWTSPARYGEMGDLPRLGTRWSRSNPHSDGGAACILLGDGVCSGEGRAAASPPPGD